MRNDKDAASRGDADRDDDLALRRADMWRLERRIGAVEEAVNKMQESFAVGVREIRDSFDKHLQGVEKIAAVLDSNFKELLGAALGREQMPLKAAQWMVRIFAATIATLLVVITSILVGIKLEWINRVLP